MKRSYIKGCILVSILIVFAYFTYEVFLKTTYAGGYLTSLEVPTWLREDFFLSEPITSKEPGPIIECEEDCYGVFRIKFFNADTDEVITDKAVLNELISMFSYSDEPFVYDESRTRGGMCFFYYNGVLPACQPASLFSGFNGTTIPFKEGMEIEGFYMKYHASTIPASTTDNLEEALDQFIMDYIP